MRRIQQFGALLALSVIACAQTKVPIEDEPPPSDSDQKAILDRITQNALKYSNDLPDFVCNRLTRRSVDPTGFSQSWRTIDTVDEELSFTGHKENYKTVSVNGKSAAGSHRSGSASYEFGDALSWIFAPNVQADLKWHSWTLVNQRRTQVFAYSITQPKSQFFIGASKNKVAASIAGMVYADAETANVMRVIVIATSPAKFPITNVTYDLTYDFIKVGGQRLVLPVKSDYHAKDGKSLVWTEVEFRRYRQPGSDAAGKLETR
ncbi:MAG: hypothetical protein ABSB35_10035 [Bryobacteraceae bacterium]|jgi:hypothetical protein